MKTFKEYAQDKDIKVIKSILIEEGYDEPTQEQLVNLLEAGLLQKLGKSKLGKAAKAATLTAAMAGAGIGQVSAQSPNQQQYAYSYSDMQGDKQAVKDFKQDRDWLKKNRPSLEKDFRDKRSPSEERLFKLGAKMKADTQVITKHIQEIKDGVSKVTFSDTMIEVIQSEDLGTGGIEVVADISGVITASSEKDAKNQIEKKLNNFLKAKGYKVEGMKSLFPKADKLVISKYNQQEAIVGSQSFPYKVRVKFLIPK